MSAASRTDLTTREEIEAIAERAFAVLESRSWMAGPFPLFDAAMDALRFCVSAAEALRDPALLPLVRDALGFFADANDYLETNRSRASSAIGALARHMTEVDDDIEALASHELAEVRLAIASALQPSCAGRRELLLRLASDRELAVRKAAKASLGDDAPPWWSSLFRADPLAQLDAGQATRFTPLLRELAEGVDAGELDPEGVAGLAKKLPDALAIELVVRTFERGVPMRAALLALLGRGERGVDALLAGLPSWIATPTYPADAASILAAAIAASPRAKSICERLVVAALAVPDGGHRDWSVTAAKAVVAAWPASLPGRFIVDRLPRGDDPKRGFDYVRAHLLDLFDGKKRLSDEKSLAREALSLRATGGDGPLRPWLKSFDPIVARLPKKALRAAAERAVASPQDEDVAWAVKLLAGPLHDPVRDGKRAVFLARLEREPRMRRAILDAMPEAILPLLRQRLRRGEVDFETLVKIKHTTWSLWGDVEAEGDAPKRRARRSALRDLLGPKTLRGPLTAEEWERIREVRAAAPRSYEFWLHALQMVPPGPRTPADEAFVEEAMRAVRSDYRVLGYFLTMMISSAPVAGDERRIAELIAIDGDEMGSLARELAVVRRKLGLPDLDDEEAPPEATKTGAAPEWMDVEES